MENNDNIPESYNEVNANNNYDYNSFQVVSKIF